MNVFSYGSNMLIERLRAENRAPSAVKVGVGVIHGRSLRFHKRSSDKSGKCDLFLTGLPDDIVHGVVFSIPEKEMPALRTEEGVGSGYHEELVNITLRDGTEVNAAAFIADENSICASARPYSWYKRLVVAGAEQNGLPAAYISGIMAVPVKRDRYVDRKTKRQAEVALKSYRELKRALEPPPIPLI
jgi:cation transport regulator ChaC